MGRRKVDVIDHARGTEAGDLKMLAEISGRCNAVEQCYEFMLAYAAQGLPNDRGSQSGGQVRECLQRAVQAIDGLAKRCASAVKEEGIEPAAQYEAFFAVL